MNDLALRLRRVASEALALAEEVEARERIGAQYVASQKFVTTGVAAKIVDRSPSWLYAIARKHPQLGHKTPSGSWVWDPRELRAFMARSSANFVHDCEVCEAPILPPQHNSAQG